MPLKDGTRPRPKAFPSIIGWRKDWYPARIEIWKKGTWFHYIVNCKGHQHGPGDAQELPPILEHYYRYGLLVVDLPQSQVETSESK